MPAYMKTNDDGTFTLYKPIRKAKKKLPIGKVSARTPLRMTKKEYSVYVLKKPGAKKARAKRKMVMTAEDRAWSAAVRAKAGVRCEWGVAHGQVCGNYGGGQVAHHVISRSNKATRHYVPCGVALCNGHHYNWHKYPIKFLDWIISVRSQSWVDDLKAKSNIRKTAFK